MTTGTDQPDASVTPVEPARLTLPQRPRPWPRRSGPFGRTGHSIRAWAENTFSREQVVDGVKRLLWVAPLTLLIWVYAEREQIVPLANPVTIPISLVSDDPTRIVTLVSPSEPYVSVKLTGPRAQMDTLRGLLESRGREPLPIIVPRGGGLGLQRIPTARLGQDRVFEEYGATISNLQPEMLEVMVDELVEVPVPVQATGRTPLLKDPTFTPATVTVRGPKAVLAAANVDKRLFAVADLEGRPEIAAAIARGDPSVELRDLPVTSALKDGRVTLVGPKTVSAVLDLKERKTWTIPFMNVFVVSPPELLGDYEVTYEGFLRDVTVIGPAEIIDKVQQEGYLPRPKAMFEITSDDVGERKTAPLEFKLPPGVTLKPGQADKERIEFKLTKRP